MNQAPIVTIVEPAQGSTFVVNTQVTLEATVSDPEDGRLPQRSIFWEGSHGAIVDPLGTGELITTEFYEPNEWVLTVTATDSEGLETSASVTVTVTE